MAENFFNVFREVWIEGRGLPVSSSCALANAIHSEMVRRGGSAE